jgi:hypothetical protein
MKNKRIAALLVAVLLSVQLLLTGCGGTTAPAETAPTTTATQSVIRLKPYVLRYRDTTIRMNAYAPPVIQDLGKPLTYNKAAGTVTGKTEDVYGYEGLILRAGRYQDTRVILSALIEGADIRTPEGIGIGDELQAVVERYGEGTAEGKDVLSYRRDGAKLSFRIQNNVVESILYELDTDFDFPVQP